MGKLPSVAGDNSLVGLVVFPIRDDLVQYWDDKDCSFAHTRLSLTENVLALESQRNGFDLDLTGVLKAAFTDSSFELIFEEEFIPSGEVGALVLLVGLLDLFLVLVGTVVVIRHNLRHDSYSNNDIPLKLQQHLYSYKHPLVYTIIIYFYITKITHFC